MIAAKASAFPVYEDGRTGDAFAESERPTVRKALWDLQAYNADEWRRVEQDPGVGRVEVVVEVER